MICPIEPKENRCHVAKENVVIECAYCNGEKCVMDRYGLKMKRMQYQL